MKKLAALIAVALLIIAAVWGAGWKWSRPAPNPVGAYRIADDPPPADTTPADPGPIANPDGWSWGD